MRPLIAVVTCHTRMAYQQVIRDTWLPLVKEADVRFFLGPSDRIPREDEVFLDCNDSYEGLPSKVRAIMRWSLGQDYEYTLKLDDDVVLKPEKLLSSGFQNYDFIGHRNSISQFPIPYGFAYWLSRKPMFLVANSELPKDNNDEAWVTRTLAQAKIALHNDERYAIHLGRREDFIGDGANNRALRVRPPRIGLQSAPATADVFAQCIHINWAGYHRLPEHRILEEFNKVWKQTGL